MRGPRYAYLEQRFSPRIRHIASALFVVTGVSSDNIFVVHETWQQAKMLRVNGELCTSFVRLEEWLDTSVGGQVSLQICRGGEVKMVKLPVDDLHGLTPARYFEVGGAVVNELSYQQARNHGVPAKGVYVAHPGYMLRQGRISRGCIIDAVNGVATPDIDSFIAAMTARLAAPAVAAQSLVTRVLVAWQKRQEVRARPISPDLAKIRPISP